MEIKLRGSFHWHFQGTSAEPMEIEKCMEAVEAFHCVDGSFDNFHGSYHYFHGSFHLLPWKWCKLPCNKTTQAGSGIKPHIPSDANVDAGFES